MLDGIPSKRLLVVLMAIVPAAVDSGVFSPRAEAAPRPVLFYDGRAVVKPRSVDAAKVTTRSGGAPFDETIYRARRLRWSGWGTSRATGRGRITFCVIDYRPCRTRRGSVTVSRIWINGCGDLGRRSYRYVRWNFPGARSPRVEAMPAC